MRTFVTTDIHGAYLAFMQVMEKAGFDYLNDRLICLGDVCDRGPETSKVLDELMKIRNLIFIIGNHDLWALEWALTGEIPSIWDAQGGAQTRESYSNGMPEEHVRLLQEAPGYYEEGGRLFVHAGIRPELPVQEQDQEVFLWDRSLVSEAILRKNGNNEKPVTTYLEVFLGHTPTLNFEGTWPIHACEVWLMDTGAGWGGPLSLINLETKEIFQSDLVTELYAGGIFKGRNRIK